MLGFWHEAIVTVGFVAIAVLPMASGCEGSSWTTAEPRGEWVRLNGRGVVCANTCRNGERHRERRSTNLLFRCCLFTLEVYWNGSARQSFLVQVSQYCLISTKANQRQLAVFGECQDVQWAHWVAIGLGLGSFSLLRFRWHCLAARCAFHSLILCLCMQRRLPSMGLATQHPSAALNVGFTDWPGSSPSVQRDGESRYG